MTLTEFLLAEIAKDEAVARAVTPGPWCIEKTSSHMDKETWAVADVERFRDYTNYVHVGEDKPLAIYIARWDPARVLAECEAKRAIMKLHSAEPGQHPDFCGHDLRELPCPTLRLLALPYSDRADYLPEWKT